MQLNTNRNPQSPKKVVFFHPMRMKCEFMRTVYSGYTLIEILFLQDNNFFPQNMIFIS